MASHDGLEVADTIAMLLAPRAGLSLLLPPPPPSPPPPAPERDRPRRAESGEKDLAVAGGEASFLALVRFEEIFETCIQGEEEREKEEWEEEEWEKERQGQKRRKEARGWRAEM